MKNRIGVPAVAVLIFTLIWPVFAGQAHNKHTEPGVKKSRIPAALLNDVRKAGLERGGYRLGFALTPEQAGKASANPLPGTAPGTFRFRDGDLQIVAEQGSNIVILISEYHDDWTVKATKGLIGSFTLGFGFPSATAHGRTLYWFYDANGRLLDESEYRDYVAQAGDNAVVATIKCQTGSFILSKTEAEKKTDTDNLPDSVYYLIYSNPLLKLFVK